MINRGRFSNESARELRAIEFDGDPDGYEGLGFPIVKSLRAVMVGNDGESSSVVLYSKLKEQICVQERGFYGAELAKFSWEVSQVGCSASLALRLPGLQAVFRYSSVSINVHGPFFDRLQGLVVEALLVDDEGIRHELVFQNAILIIESESLFVDWEVLAEGNDPIVGGRNWK